MINTPERYAELLASPYTEDMKGGDAKEVLMEALQDIAEFSQELERLKGIINNASNCTIGNNK